jgi:glycosyltransferase involved in cell wall biosynthesis
MQILVLNQTFYPDVVSSGQHLADLASDLAARGHDVTVITGRRAYDDPKKVFPKRETCRGVRVLRVWATGFGKRSKWRRAADFATFLCSCCWRLLRLPRQDLIIAMTSPPLISYIGAWFSRLRGGRFCYWIMDLNPDEALAAGWLSPDSLAAKLLERLSRFSLRNASKTVVLDHFMRKRILEKNIEAQKISVIPPWSHDSSVHFDSEGRVSFRRSHGLEEKFVIMYSGNHSPCHPLDTILNAAKQLADHRGLAFLFVGGGSEFAKVQKFALDNSLANILCLPYQPMDQLAGALSAADLHLVVMGNPFVGLVHPCKIYNILRIGSPVLYIGPELSHISEILAQSNGHLPFGQARHGDVSLVIQSILRLKESGVRPNREKCLTIAERFSKGSLLPQFVKVLESAGVN